MTRLANPAAVARFADDNVAHFPNGGGGDVATAAVKFVNTLNETKSVQEFVTEAYFCDVTNRAYFTQAPGTYGVEANSEFDSNLILARSGEVNYYCMLNENITASDLVNAEVLTAGDLIGIIPIDISKPSSFTLTNANI